MQPIELFNASGQAPVLLLSDHSGRWIPPYLGDLGLPEEERSRHIGWDIGTTDMTRRLAALLDAPAVLNHVSRLVIDPNRYPDNPMSIPEVSDGTAIPANHGITEEERRRRLRLSFVPYHATIARQIARLRRRVSAPVIISMHSFTPRMQHVWRPWDVGVLWTEDDRIAAPVLQTLREDRSLCVGDNLPYAGDYPGAFTVKFHAEMRRFPHVAFEVRQDLIDTRPRAEAWAERLAEVLHPVLADPKLYQLWGSRRREAHASTIAIVDVGRRRRIPSG